MKKLIAALVAGMFAAATVTAFAADPVKSAGATDKPGRAADEGKDSVKSGGASEKPGRGRRDTFIRQAIGNDTSRSCHNRRGRCFFRNAPVSRRTSACDGVP